MANILIVDDDVEMQDIYKDLFKEEVNEYAIDIVGDGVTALKMMKERSFDLIILDIIMEPIAGDSFFAYVRNDVRTTHLPIIIVSVLSPVTLEHLRKINHVHFLQKPITKLSLFSKINEVLS
jgi:CheY-like chemotaxis protein